MRKSDVEAYVVPNFRCKVAERPLGKLGRNPRLLEKTRDNIRNCHGDEA